MQSRKKDKERMAEVVPQSDKHALQHFLSNFFWDERAVLEQGAREADAPLGGTAERALMRAGSPRRATNRSGCAAMEWTSGKGRQLPGACIGL